MLKFLTRHGIPVFALGLIVAIGSIDPAAAQQLKKAEDGLTNFLKFFEGNMGNIIVALAIIAAVFMILARRASVGMAAGVVVLAMILANAKILADQLDAWF